ncbi:F0F1 ATP synthase subunit B' [Roseivivax marinus]|jgi:F-type H+-transporting ATPase subunit b|uniref:ATP synthase subunit b n=1 Tax=Roseivivax marinus TaxID=1379903 RepID=W4HDC2_9RHOB|nr:F0F1 ATP synthase subunit B' [Roseivivax marinus]ETW10739.1 F0F1 ATP synthase subunit B' [Roseivivax marinus]UMA64181.1 F0F1 ATP synthase subunit B' [Roseivivax marinus]SEK28638.1 F-type H+-transporting ATPase subunit b [Roseivivax marinus]
MATEPYQQELAGACVGPNGSAIGMPQLCGDWVWNQVFWLVLALVAIYFVLNRVALPRIAAILAERQGTITGDLAKAEDLKRSAEEAEAAYDKALADARTEARKIADETRAEIRAEVEEAEAKADADIAAKTAESEKQIAEIRASALANVEQVAKETAEALVAALGIDASKAELDAAVDKRIEG